MSDKVKREAHLFRFQREHAEYVVTTGSVPSKEIRVSGQLAAAKLADKTNGSYRRDW